MVPSHLKTTKEMKMKKLMFTILATVALSAVSHGAAFVWGTEASSALSAYKDDTVYVLLASDWASMDPKSAANVASKALSSSGYSKSRTNYSIPDKTFTYGADDLASLDVVMVDINADGQYFTWNQTLTGNDPANASPATTTYSATQIDGFKTAAGGYKSFSGGGGVPEPTSGLLLALGGAMLALRRRRA